MTGATFGARLAKARADYVDAVRAERIAEAECPHWDYNGLGTGHSCCDHLAACEQRTIAARKRLRALEAQQVTA